MTHKVNAAVLRIGKSLNWHSLGSPFFRWRDLKTNLFLNYFLSRFLERESYRLVRYAVRSESRVLKIAIIAFRLINTSIGLTRDSVINKYYYESYWRNHNVYKYRFRLGVFRHVVQEVNERITPFTEDVEGVGYLNKFGRMDTIPRKSSKKTPIFLIGGVEHQESDEGVAQLGGAVGTSHYFYKRNAVQFAAFRYAIKKSILRLIKKKIMPKFSSKLFKRKLRYFSPLSFKSRVLTVRPPKGKKLRNLLLAFLICKTGSKRFLSQHFKFFAGPRLGSFIDSRAKFKRMRLRRKRFSKMAFSKFKKKYFKFRREWQSWKKKWLKRIVRKAFDRAFWRGKYIFRKFFSRLKKAKKPFRYERVDAKVRSSKNRITRLFFNRKKEAFLRKESLCTNGESNALLNLFFSGLSNVIFLLKLTGAVISPFLFNFIFKIINNLKKNKSLNSLRTPRSSLPSILPIYRTARTKVPAVKSLVRYLKYFNKLSSIFNVKVLGVAFFRKLSDYGRRRVKKKFFNKNKINLFFYFFFNSMSIFKFNKIKLKTDSVKYLYRRKKLIFFFEKRLSVFLRKTVELSFYNPLDFNSMDDLWVRSLYDSLSFISNMYLRDKFDYKPAFILSLSTMLAFKYNSPAFLGSYVANQLEWRWRKRAHMSFIRLLIYFFRSLKFSTMYSKDLINLSIGFYGKVWGKLRAGKFIIRSGSGRALPLRRIALRTDSSFTWAESQFGTFGIRIWMARN